MKRDSPVRAGKWSGRYRVLAAAPNSGCKSPYLGSVGLTHLRSVLCSGVNRQILRSCDEPGSLHPLTIYSFMCMIDTKTWKSSSFRNLS